MTAKAELEDADWCNSFSPETSALLKGLGDTPDSLALKSEYLKSFNTLRRGLLAIDIYSDTKVRHLEGIIVVVQTCSHCCSLRLYKMNLIEEHSCFQTLFTMIQNVVYFFSYDGHGETCEDTPVGLLVEL